MSLIPLGAIDEGLHARLTLEDSLASCLMVCVAIFEWLSNWYVCLLQCEI